MHTLHKYNIPHILIKQGYKIPLPKNELENYADAFAFCSHLGELTQI